MFSPLVNMFLKIRLQAYLPVRIHYLFFVFCKLVSIVPYIISRNNYLEFLPEWVVWKNHTMLFLSYIKSVASHYNSPLFFYYCLAGVAQLHKTFENMSFQLFKLSSVSVDSSLLCAVRIFCMLTYVSFCLGWCMQRFPVILFLAFLAFCSASNKKKPLLIFCCSEKAYVI